MEIELNTEQVVAVIVIGVVVAFTFYLAWMQVQQAQHMPVGQGCYYARLNITSLPVKETDCLNRDGSVVISNFPDGVREYCVSAGSKDATRIA